MSREWSRMHKELSGLRGKWCELCHEREQEFMLDARGKRTRDLPPPASVLLLCRVCLKTEVAWRKEAKRAADALAWQKPGGVRRVYFYGPPAKRGRK